VARGGLEYPQRVQRRQAVNHLGKLVTNGMSFSYAIGENSSFVLPLSRDYLPGRDRSEHEI
jgi:hypothetical protein